LAGKSVSVSCKYSNKHLLKVVLVSLCVNISIVAKCQHYYDLVNKAEISIVDSNYHIALKSYKGAFKKSTRFFAKDIFNAATCAQILKKDYLAKSYLLLLSEKGVSLSFIKKSKLLKGYFRDSIFAASYEKMSKNFHNNLKNKVLVKKLDSLLNSDQYYRRKGLYNGLYKGIYRDSIFAADKANAIALKKIIDDYGFPHEDVIGVTPFGKSKYNINSFEDFLIIILHQTNLNLTVNFRESLLKAVEEYKITPQNAAFLIGLQEGRDSYGIDKASFRVTLMVDSLKNHLPDSIKSKIDKWVLKKISSKTEEELNINRKNINLEPLSDYRKKILYLMRNKKTEFIFSDTGGHSTYATKDLKSIQSLLSNTYLIE
jgi:hypothetical protein